MNAGGDVCRSRRPGPQIRLATPVLVMNIEHENEVTRTAFGQWVSGLFGAVCGCYPNTKFHEQKELFFLILEKLLKSGRVIFIVPGSDCYISAQNPTPKLTIENPEAHWNAPVSEIMNFVRNKWPAQANDMHDLELTYYFYELPGLIWVGDDGKLVAS